eukprot:g3266.t1
MPGDIKLSTTPVDPRFTSYNQAQHCWTRYNEWLLCVDKTGDSDVCQKFKKYAHSICPEDWTNKWAEDREEGTFCGYKPAAEGSDGH